jgi:adenylate cyclase
MLQDLTPARLREAAVALTAGVLVAAFVTYAVPSARAVDEIMIDLFHAVAGRLQPTPNTVLVTLDDETLTATGQPNKPLVAWLPDLARVAGVARAAGAQAVALDALLSMSLSRWLAEVEGSGNEPGGGSELSRTFDAQVMGEIATGKLTLIAVARGAGDATPEGAARNGATGLAPPPLMPADDYLLALPDLLEADEKRQRAIIGRHVGYANIYSDDDGVVRHWVAAPLGPEASPRLTLPLLLTLQATGANPLADEWAIRGHVYTPDDAWRRIPYVGPPDSIATVSMVRLLRADPARIDPALKHALAGRIVIVTLTNTTSQDRHLTPYARQMFGQGGRWMAGSELHAQIIEALLAGRSWHEPSDLQRLLIGGLAALLVAMASLLFGRPGLFTLTAIGPFALLAAGYAGFRVDQLVPMSIPFAALVTTVGADFAMRAIGEDRRRRELQRMFGRFVSDEVVDMLLRHPERLKPGGVEMSVTVLFSDIRNFTTISEKMKPGEVVEMLNEHFRRVTELSLREGGTIFKFIGDAVMIVYGAPYAHDDHARRALRTALHLQAEADGMAAWMRARFRTLYPDLPPFKIGVGVHTGRAIVGNIGSLDRMDYTAIGDTVNLASRLEGESKEFASAIAISGSVVAAVPASLLLGEHVVKQVKGREEPVDVYEFIGFGAADSGHGGST